VGTHRKPKARPTAFAAVVTAAIVVPAGTAAATTLGGFDPLAGKQGQHGLSAAAGQLAANARSAASSAANSASRRLAAAASGPSASPTAKPSASASASPSASHPAKTPPASASPSKTSASPSHSASPTPTASRTPAQTKPTTIAAPDPYKSVTLAGLEPTGLYGAQQYFTPNSAQWANAKTIVAVTKQRGLPPYAAVIATATAMQESSLINLGSASNYDSLGLFQQRPSMGWGTAAQVTDPAYATNAFLTALLSYAPDYMHQSLWVSAQAVQRSGFPTAYAQWEAQAAKIVLAIAHGTA